ncbi:MAG TPA: NAD(P)-dependent alcohol dehydrogenase [Gaiellaceae bacterium]|nr:NAD(P)-dependent alcohol dehydrogenase [Gaiellaceae bacterium]
MALPIDAGDATTAADLPATMKAAVLTRYGTVEVMDVPTPEIEAHQVLIRVHASSVNPADWYKVVGPSFARVMTASPRAKRGVVGGDVAGRVVAVGKDVHDLAPGDDVFGLSPAAWGEYAKARADRVARKPARLSFEEAGAVPVVALTALQALRDKGGVRPGWKVLVNGASGGVGTFAVQIAKALGAEVTAVCSTTKVDLVRSLGADRVVDYTREDFTRLPVRHELMVDVAGSRPFREFARVLTRDATVVIVGGPMNRGLGPIPHLVATLASGRLRPQKTAFFVARGPREDMEFLGELLASGKVRSIVEATYDLEHVGDALAHLGEGHARGKIVLTFGR